MMNILNIEKRKINIREDNIIVKCKGNLCYIYNENLKRHLFISKEVLEYVKEAYKNNLDISNFINLFKREADKNYMINTIDKLIEVGYLVNENIEKNYENCKSFESAYFMLTKRCNLKCTHCSVCASPKEKDILSFEDYTIILKNLAKLKPKNIIFTGGEPLLIPEFEQILKLSKKLIPNVNLILSTNGTLFSNENIHLANYFNKIDISIDGVDEETCSKVRGNGIFNKVINNIRLLQNSGFLDIHLSMTFGEKTRHLAKKFKNLNKELNTTPVFRSFEPIGRGYENYNQFNEDKHHLPISTTEMYKIKSNSRHISSCSCNAFESNIYIDYKGDVYPCLALVNENHKIFNINSKNFEKEELCNILDYKKNKFKQILKYKGTKCENCDLNIFCWNCPAIFETAKNNKEINIWCDRMKDNLNEIVWRQV